MRLLLDTHAILWMLSDDPKLSPSARNHIRSAEQLVFSSASFWEMGIKTSLGRADFRLAPKWSEKFESELRFNGATKINIETRHCARVATLPWLHRDPFDRMLIAQAMEENLSFLSRDSSVSEYDLDVVW